MCIIYPNFDVHPNNTKIYDIWKDHKTRIMYYSNHFITPGEFASMFLVIGGTVLSQTFTTDIDQLMILPRETSKDQYGIGKCLCSFDEGDAILYYNVMKDGWDVKAYRLEEFMRKYKNANNEFQDSVMSVIIKTYNQLGFQNMSIVEANFKRHETRGKREAIGIVYEPAFGNTIILPLAHENSKPPNDSNNNNFIKYDVEFFVEDAKVQHFGQIYKDSLVYDSANVKNVFQGTPQSYKRLSIEHRKTCFNCKQLNNYVLKLSDVAFMSNGDDDDDEEKNQRIRTGVYGHLNNCMLSQNLNIIMKLNILY